MNNHGAATVLSIEFLVQAFGKFSPSFHQTFKISIPWGQLVANGLQLPSIKIFTT